MFHGDPAQNVEHLGPAERAAQVGSKAWKKIIARLAGGRDAKLVMLVDLRPHFGDVIDATWQLQKEAAAELPFVLGCGLYVTSNPTEASKYQGMLSYVRGLLLREWWEPSPESGPPEPRATSETTVSKPALKVLTYENSGRAVVPALLRDRFSDAEDSVRQQWQSMCANAMRTLESLSSLTSARPTGSEDVVGINLQGPELAEYETTTDMFGHDLANEVEEILMSDVEAEQRLLGYTCNPFQLHLNLPIS